MPLYASELAIPNIKYKYSSISRKNLTQSLQYLLLALHHLEIGWNSWLQPPPGLESCRAAVRARPGRAGWWQEWQFDLGQGSPVGTPLLGASGGKKPWKHRKKMANWLDDPELSNFRGRRQEGSSHKMCSANLIRKLWTCLGATKSPFFAHLRGIILTGLVQRGCQPVPCQAAWVGILRAWRGQKF